MRLAASKDFYAARTPRSGRCCSTVPTTGWCVSAPTLSRVVVELERRGLLISETPPGQARLKVLHPTSRALGILTARAQDAFGEFAGIVASAERRSADAAQAVAGNNPTAGHTPA